MKVMGGPTSGSQCSKTRTTRGTFIDTGEQFHITDDWKNPDMAHEDMKGYWTGTTTFNKL